jgi:hypothetical protein
VGIRGCRHGGRRARPGAGVGVPGEREPRGRLEEEVLEVGRHGGERQRGETAIEGVVERRSSSARLVGFGEAGDGVVAAGCWCGGGGRGEAEAGRHEVCGAVDWWSGESVTDGNPNSEMCHR